MLIYWSTSGVKLEGFNNAIRNVLGVNLVGEKFAFEFCVFIFLD
jgi:hypothetical protein